MKITRFFIFLIFIVLSFVPLLGEEEVRPDAARAPFSQPKFVPDISVILDLSAAWSNAADNVRRGMFIPGFTHGGGGEGHGHAPAGENIGFNFNYAEIAMFSSVDPYLELFAVFHFGPESIEVEEAYISTTALPLGLGVKAGKFKSRFGRLNLLHRHQWNFSDQPLVHRAFFGEEGINEIGAQAALTLPVPIYLSVGAEALKGDNEASFGSGAFHDPAYLYRVGGARGPNLYTGFVRCSFDIGSLTALGGGSFAWGITRSSHTLDEVDLTTASAEDLEGLGHGVRARTWIAGADLTVRYGIDSYRYVVFQTEYLFRRMLGRMYEYEAADSTQRFTLTREQSGLYAELVAKPFLRWRFGSRFDLLNKNSVAKGGRNLNLPWNRYRISAMTDWLSSEFTLLRLQYNYDRSGQDRFGRRRTGHEVVLQLNAAIGAHGAHSF